MTIWGRQLARSHPSAFASNITELITGFGERGVPAERIATSVAEQVRRYLAAEVPVGEHLADQLLLPMALGSGGTFRTLAPSLHCTTQLQLLELFLGVKATVVQERADVWRLELEPALDVNGRTVSRHSRARPLALARDPRT